MYDVRHLVGGDFESADDVARDVRTHVDKYGWRIFGGTNGVISVFNDRLAVTAPKSTQRMVNDFLKLLAARPTRPAERRPEPVEAVVFPAPVHDDMTLGELVTIIDAIPDAAVDVNWEELKMVGVSETSEIRVHCDVDTPVLDVLTRVMPEAVEDAWVQVLSEGDRIRVTTIDDPTLPQASVVYDIDGLVKSLEAAKPTQQNGNGGAQGGGGGYGGGGFGGGGGGGGLGGDQLSPADEIAAVVRESVIPHALGDSLGGLIEISPLTTKLVVTAPDHVQKDVSDLLAKLASSMAKP